MPHRINNLWEKIIDLDLIKQAIKKSAQNKTTRPDVMKILADVDGYSLKIQQMLINDNIKWGNDHKFVYYEPGSRKFRKITEPSYYPDLIIQWCLILVLQTRFQQTLLPCCVGSIPGKGVTFGMKKCKRYLKTKQAKHILKNDIVHYFENINLFKLEQKLAHLIKDRKILILCHVILMRGATNNKGLPIGYYTSQWFSNIYLTDFDHYVYEHLKPYKYIRFVDDFVIFDSNRRRLKRMLNLIIIYLQMQDLSIKPNWSLFNKKQRPLDFLGYRFYPDKIYLRKRMFYRLNRLWKRAANQKRMHIKTARICSSLYGWLTHTSNSRVYYLNHLKPIIKKRRIFNTISQYDKLVKTSI